MIRMSAMAWGVSQLPPPFHPARSVLSGAACQPLRTGLSFVPSSCLPLRAPSSWCSAPPVAEGRPPPLLSSLPMEARPARPMAGATAQTVATVETPSRPRMRPSRAARRHAASISSVCIRAAAARLLRALRQTTMRERALRGSILSGLARGGRAARRVRAIRARRPPLAASTIPRARATPRVSLRTPRATFRACALDVSLAGSESATPATAAKVDFNALRRRRLVDDGKLT